MSTLSIAEVAAQPELVFDAVQQRGIARIRLADGREYVLKPVEQHDNQAVRLRGITPRERVTRPELLDILRAAQERR